MNKEGVVAAEIGFGQTDAVAAIAAENGFCVENVMKDHNGIDRVITAGWIN